MATVNRLYRTYGKPAIDRFLAIVLCVLLAPVLAVVAVLVRLRLGSPVLFRQERVGRGERAFQLLKFRSMTGATDGRGRLLPDADRVTALGRFLRMYSLDELPQLWNVLNGEMSLVGPRPLYRHYLPYYSDRERRRHEARPGITGLAQVSGRNRLSWDERLELDVRYVETAGIGLDLSILLQTIHRVLSRRDVVEVPETSRVTLVEARRGRLEP